MSKQQDVSSAWYPQELFIKRIITLIIRIFLNFFLHGNVLYNRQVGYGAAIQNEVKQLFLNNARWPKLFHSCWVLLHPIPSFISRTYFWYQHFVQQKCLCHQKKITANIERERERETQFISTNIFRSSICVMLGSSQTLAKQR